MNKIFRIVIELKKLVQNIQRNLKYLNANLKYSEEFGLFYLVRKGKDLTDF